MLLIKVAFDRIYSTLYEYFIDRISYMISSQLPIKCFDEHTDDPFIPRKRVISKHIIYNQKDKSHLSLLKKN